MAAASAAAIYQIFAGYRPPYGVSTTLVQLSFLSRKVL